MSRRMERINVLLRQEISRVVSNELRDPRLSSMVSVTRVDSSPDLRRARAYVSVFGGESEKRNTMKALQSAAGFIHKCMRKRVSLRAIPSLDFELDESIERGAELLQMIDEVNAGLETVEDE